MENVISKEVAIAEVNRWLDSKKIGEKKRASYEKTIEELVSYVEDGTLSLDEKNMWKHKLLFPIESEKTTSELTYKNRLNVDEVTNGLKGADGTAQDMVKHYVVMLTGKVKGIINKLDTQDYSVCQSISVFFL